MATGIPVQVHIPGGGTVRVRADRDDYAGTITHGPGNGNEEIRAVTICGHEMQGRWNGDARWDTEVYSPPAELIPLFRAIRAARDYEHDRRDAQSGDIEWADVVREPSAEQYAILEAHGYTRAGRRRKPRA